MVKRSYLFIKGWFELLVKEMENKNISFNVDISFISDYMKKEFNDKY